MIKKVMNSKNQLFVLDVEKEEKWLNEMASKGLALKKVPLFAFSPYKFEECEPDEYVIRVQAFDNSFKYPQREKYIRFLKGMGAEVVHYGGDYVYVRKRNDPDFALVSDDEWKIKFYSEKFKSYLISSIFSSVGLALILSMLIIIKPFPWSTFVVGIIFLRFVIEETASFIKSAKILARAKRENNKTHF